MEDEPIEEEQQEEEQPQSVAPQTLIDKANEVAERIEKANQETKELLNRQEAIKIKEQLGGKSDAGQTKPKLTKDQKADAAAREMLKGSGYEDELFPTE